MFGHQRQELTREWIQIHSEELHDLHPSPNIRVIKKNEMSGACSANGGEEWSIQGMGVKN
jgi:hypothetical protein